MLTQLMLTIFSPTLVPPALGLQVKFGMTSLAGPVLPWIRYGTWSGVPYHGIPIEAMSPPKPIENGTPLAKVEIPENCQPLTMAPSTPPLLVKSGNCRLNDAFAMCVR